MHQLPSIYVNDVLNDVTYAFLFLHVTRLVNFHPKCCSANAFFKQIFKVERLEVFNNLPIKLER